MIYLPLSNVWDMKTGGILSRLTGDIDTTTGLLQMALISPAISVLRLVIAMGILFSLNWRLALTALAIIPGAMLMSFAFARRIRPIYRSVRKDVERIDGDSEYDRADRAKRSDSGGGRASILPSQPGGLTQTERIKARNGWSTSNVPAVCFFESCSNGAYGGPVHGTKKSLTCD